MAERKTKSKAHDGDKRKIMEQVGHRLDNPSAPFPVAIDPSQRATPAKMFADGGRKITIMRVLAQRSKDIRFPQTADEVYASLEGMLEFCTQYQLSPTLGIFAIWNGVTMQRVWQIEREHDERARAVSVCKEVIRSIIEQSAIEAEFNPLLYFNSMKSQFGLAEDNKITVTHVEDNATEITEDEYKERVVQLTQGEDGVYR